MQHVWYTFGSDIGQNSDILIKQCFRQRCFWSHPQSHSQVTYMQTKMKQETSEPHHSIFWTAETFPSHIQCSEETCSSTDIAEWKFPPSESCQYQTSSTRQQWQSNKSENDWRITIFSGRIKKIKVRPEKKILLHHCLRSLCTHIWNSARSSHHLIHENKKKYRKRQ